MRSIHVHASEDENCLRFVFYDRVVSFGLGADVTFGEVARTLSELARKHYGNPVGIDFMLASRRPFNGFQLRRSPVTLPGPTAGARTRAPSKIATLSSRL
jgi:hypothetical protein